MGAVTDIVVDAAGAGYLTPGLKKFVDTLPGDGEAEANNMGQYIPIAVPDTTTYPGTDYYEIALVQYREKFASSLPATLLRGYVQLSTGVVPGKHVALGNANLDPATRRTPRPATTAWTRPTTSGPTIVATKDRPVRVLFRNLLPTGTDGNLFLPVDTTLMGSGEGPNMMTLDANGVPMDMATDEGTRHRRRAQPDVRAGPQADGLLQREPRHRAPARRHHPVDQRRHPAPVDDPGR